MSKPNLQTRLEVAVDDCLGHVASERSNLLVEMSNTSDIDVIATLCDKTDSLNELYNHIMEMREILVHI